MTSPVVAEKAADVPHFVGREGPEVLQRIGHGLKPRAAHGRSQFRIEFLAKYII